MRDLALATALLLVICPSYPVRAQQQDGGISAADPAAIVALITPLERSQAFAQVHWENAFGVRQNGLAELTHFLTERVRPTMTNSRRDEQDLRLTVIAPDVVVADRCYPLIGQTDEPGGTVLPDRHIRQTYVLKKVGEDWHVMVERIADLRR